MRLLAYASDVRLRPVYDDGTARCFLGDARAVLRKLPDESVQCVVSSPPYFGLRAYGTDAQLWGGDPRCDHRWGPALRAPCADAASGPNGRGINHAVSRWRPKETGPFCLRCGAWRGELGLEPSVDVYVAHIVEVFREARRVLRRDGVLWLNLGDSYTSGGRTSRDPGKSRMNGGGRVAGLTDPGTRPPTPAGLKPKDLIGVPWRVALALQADGWWLRSDVIWHKPNPMPESVRDRPTRSHEYVFLLTRSPRYFYDADAVREVAKFGYRMNPNARPMAGRTAASSALWRNAGTSDVPVERGHDQAGATFDPSTGRNRRSVWTVPTRPCRDAHFATFPESLPSIAVLAGTSAAGCCPTCGAPWTRQVETAAVAPDLSQRTTSRYDTAKRYGAGNGGNGGLDALAARMRVGLHGKRTVGWARTCMHTGRPIPCTVLDPFAGTGTVLAAASALGRRAIGIELSPQYVEMLSRRLSKAAGRRAA